MERVATTYAKIAGLVPGRLQPKLPGMFPEDGQVTPSSPPPFLQYAHGTVRVRPHLLTGLWLASSGSVPTGPGMAGGSIADFLRAC